MFSWKLCSQQGRNHLSHHHYRWVLVVWKKPPHFISKQSGDCPLMSYQDIVRVRFRSPLLLAHPQMFVNGKIVYLTTQIFNTRPVIYFCIFFMHIMYWWMTVTSRRQYATVQCCLLDVPRWSSVCHRPSLCMKFTFLLKHKGRGQNAKATKAQDVSVYCS